MRKAITSVVIVCLILASLLAIGGVTAQPSEKVPVIVGFKDKPDANLIREHGGEIKYIYNLIPAVACSLSDKAIDALEKNPNIVYIELDGEVHIIQETLPWGVDRIDAELVHGYNKGTSVKVAIIDTGIDYTHPDLDANYKGGFDFVNFDGDPKDDNGHGTHCAGIVAAEDNDIGVIGVAPEAYLYAVKVLNSGGSGYLSNVILGIQWSVNNYMQVVSMSLGTSTYSQSLKDACDNAYYNAGLVLVAAAGNSGDGNSNTNEYSYPAAYASVIAVGATDKSDTAPSWSNSGPYLELAAPGVSIYSTLPTYRVTLTRTYGYNYGTLSGTSMACPHVTGTAALVKASDPTLTNVDVRTRLQTTADDLGPSGWDTVYGYGLVDADDAASGTDTKPPAISAVASSDITTSTARIAWTTDEPSDSRVNYGTTKTLGTTVYDATMVTSHSITLTGLTPGTTYYYEVQSTDSAGNSAVDNKGGSYYTFTTLTAAPSNTMHVDSIDMSKGSRPAGRNTFVWAIATVTIVDANYVPVEGATVYGHWEGATIDTDSGITDASGRVSLQSDQVKNPPTGTKFTFVVDRVELSGWTYDSSANLETSDSIEV